MNEYKYKYDDNPGKPSLVRLSAGHEDQDQEYGHGLDSKAILLVGTKMGRGAGLVVEEEEGRGRGRVLLVIPVLDDIEIEIEMLVGSERKLCREIRLRQRFCRIIRIPIRIRRGRIRRWVLLLRDRFARRVRRREQELCVWEEGEWNGRVVMRRRVEMVGGI